MNDDAGGGDLAAKYDTIAYAAQPSPWSHPDHLAVVATLFGLDPPAVRTCRTLEVGCSDGANLIPMAVSLPEATFLGCDLAARPIAAARATVAALGLANIRFVQADLSRAGRGHRDVRLHRRARRLLVGAGRRYVMRCSRWPRAIWLRTASCSSATTRSPAVTFAGRRGTSCISMSTGSPIRARGSTPRARWLRCSPGPARPTRSPTPPCARNSRGSRSGPTAPSFTTISGFRTIPCIFTSSSPMPAGMVSRTSPRPRSATMSSAGLAPEVRQMVDGLDRLTREQYLDFAHVRRYRQSLVTRADPATGFALSRAARGRRCTCRHPRR